MERCFKSIKGFVGKSAKVYIIPLAIILLMERTSNIVDEENQNPRELKTRTLYNLNYSDEQALIEHLNINVNSYTNFIEHET